MRTVELNSLQMNGVQLNGIGEYQRGSHAGAPPVVPDVPDIPGIPEEPDVPSDPDVDENGYIIFADPEVARICAENWGDGTGITPEQAEAVTSIGTVFKGNTEITSFDELEKFASVKSLSGSAFQGCSALTSIRLDNITSVGNYAFRGCPLLSSAGDMSNVETIGTYAFDSCASLNNVGTLTKVSKIDAAAFYKCTSLADVGYMASVATIGSSAFQSCPLNYVILGDAITNISSYAFDACTALSAWIIKAVTPPTLGSNAMRNTNNCPIYVPDDGTGEIVQAYKTATNWSAYASRIFSISQLEQDNNGLFNEIYEHIKDML